MSREQLLAWAREAGWSGIYTQWREPDGSPDWTPVKESLTVFVTIEQIERFAALIAAAERAACIEAVEKSRVIEFVVYPKDYLISRNDVPRCYDFQHARSIEAIRARGEKK
jgi:hypothetical protein